MTYKHADDNQHTVGSADEAPETGPDTIASEVAAWVEHEGMGKAH